MYPELLGEQMEYCNTLIDEGGRPHTSPVLVEIFEKIPVSTARFFRIGRLLIMTVKGGSG